MITTVTLNPCIDRTVLIDGFMPGGLNMVSSERIDAGGKGINSAIVLSELGADSLCIGISFSGNGMFLTQRLEELGVKHDFVAADGNIRTNIKILDTAKNEMTEINSRGDKVDTAVINAFFDKLAFYAAKSEIVMLSGRIPNGADEDIYLQCAEIISKFSAKVMLDIEKNPLKLAVKARPYIIKPNVHELNDAFGFNVSSPKETVAACREIIAQGVKIVCVSMGEQGAVIADEHSAFFAPVLDIVPKGLQGAGDSMGAGICKGIYDGAGIDVMLKMGSAAAAASIIREGTQLCKKHDYEEFFEKVIVEKI